MNLVIKMNEHIEIEYKVLISKQTFHALLKDYSLYTDYIQTNYYFTHPILKEKQYMLRIREKNNQYEMTLKRPFSKHRLETNIMLTQKEKEDFFLNRNLSNEITDILQSEGIEIKELVQEFSLMTHRYDISLKEGILSLDENQYLKKTDYELEFEVHDESGFDKFLEIIKPYQIEYTHNCDSKIKRVYDEIEKLKP